MAVMTYTRRQVVDMLPEFLTKRLATFDPSAWAAEIGLSRAGLGALNGALPLREGDLVRRGAYARRSPYAIKRPGLDEGWAEVVSAGLADASPDGWRLRPRGLELAIESSRRVRAHVRGLSVPAEPTKRVAADLQRLADRIPPSAERAAQAARIRPDPSEPVSELVTASLTASRLWGFRDDCHVGAWQDAGYDGPVFDLLSYIWSGRPDMSFTRLRGGATVDELAEALKLRQDREDVERSVATLVKRGDAAREGDAVSLTPAGRSRREAIEDETDRRYFAIWDLDDAATSRLGEDLRAVTDALPKG